MASGDVAASFGFSQVVSSEDYRLGYVRINDAADFAVKYAKKRYSSTAALTGSTGDGIGQLATDTSTGDDYRWSGTSWELWTTRTIKTFTPTWTNVTLGNATVGATYRLIDGMCFWQITLTLGSTSAVTGVPIVTLPFNVSSSAYVLFKGNASNGTSNYLLEPTVSANSVRVQQPQVSGTSLIRSDISATSPFTFASGHVISMQGIYKIY